MASRTVSINREKTFFLLAVAGLVGVFVLLAGSRPSFNPPGQQRTEFAAPPEVDISGGHVAEANPAGRNPFTRWVDPGSGVRPPVRIHHPTGPVTPVAPPPPPPPPPPPGPTTVKPKPYEVPVSFTGVYEPPEGGELCVLLKDKRTGERRRLVRGDMWPEINLRIVEISKSSVLLENEKGERFLMRDLLGRRSGGEDQGPGPKP